MRGWFVRLCFVKADYTRLDRVQAIFAKNYRAAYRLLLAAPQLAEAGIGVQAGVVRVADQAVRVLVPRHGHGAARRIRSRRDNG